MEEQQIISLKINFQKNKRLINKKPSNLLGDKKKTKKSKKEFFIYSFKAQ